MTRKKAPKGGPRVPRTEPRETPHVIGVCPTCDRAVHLCPTCKEPFYPKRPEAITCSGSCRAKKSRHTREAAEIEAANGPPAPAPEARAINQGWI